MTWFVSLNGKTLWSVVLRCSVDAMITGSFLCLFPPLIYPVLLTPQQLETANLKTNVLIKMYV